MSTLASADNPAKNYVELAEKSVLIIPLYNEAQVIGDVIARARETFPHIICVDDGSRDDSAQLARKAGAFVIEHPINLGQGAALQTGITYALSYTDAEYLVTFDADGQHRTSDALAMIQRAENEHLGFVLGSRFLDGPSQASWLKRQVLKTVAAISSHRTKMKLTDAHNGLRVLRRDAASALNLRQNRMAHASEIVSQLGQTRLAWAEQPVTIDYTDYSRSKGQSLLNGVNILTEILFG